MYILKNKIIDWNSRYRVAIRFLERNDDVQAYNIRGKKIFDSIKYSLRSNSFETWGICSRISILSDLPIVVDAFRWNRFAWSELVNITLLLSLSLSCSLSFLLPLYFFSHSPLEDSLPESRGSTCSFLSVRSRWAGFSRVKKLVFQRGDKAKSTTHIGLRV